MIPVLAITDIKLWTLILVGIIFAVYIYIGYQARARTASALYIAEQGVPAVANGMAIGADWMSAASFISMAGLISFLGFDGAIYLMGWTGGYVLLALAITSELNALQQDSASPSTRRRSPTGPSRTCSWSPWR